MQRSSWPRSWGTAGAQQQGKIDLLWLGQAAVKITSATGKVIVIDPFLTNNPKTPQQYKSLDAPGKVDLLLDARPRRSPGRRP